MKELESLMYIPLTLAMLEMQHLQEEEHHGQNKNRPEDVQKK